MSALKQLCHPRKSVFDKTKRDTVLDLSDLVQGKIDGTEFFTENFVTEGMKTLLTEAFRRLEGKSAQGLFKLTQAMGGGKTHNLIALGLLAMAALVRVVCPLVIPTHLTGALTLAGTLWAAAFGAYLVGYGRALVTPRVDGMPG